MLRHLPSRCVLAALALIPATAWSDPAPVARTAAAPTAPAPASAAPSAPAPAAPIDAAPRFELLDRGDSVEVVAHGVRATRTAVIAVRSRLEVAIAGAPQAKRVAPVDPTVKLVEFDGPEAARVLSVKLGFERPEVKALARFAQAVQVGDDLHLLLPRKAPAEGAPAPRLPEPTVPAALAARVESAVTSVLGPQRAPAAAPPAAPATAAHAAAPPGASATPPPAAPGAVPPPAAPGAVPPPAVPSASAPPAPPSAATPSDSRAAPRSAADALAARAQTAPAIAPARPSAAPDAHPLGSVLASERDDAWSKLSLYGALGLAAAGAGLWLMRRRRVRPGDLASIEIIAQRSLGGRARVVWLSAGEREMIVAITGQNVRMLGQWRKTAALPAAQTHVEDDEQPVAAPAEKPLSPAVSGLLRLRGRTGQMAAVAPDDTADDVRADELWAKEILAATTGFRAGARR